MRLLWTLRVRFVCVSAPSPWDMAGPRVRGWNLGNQAAEWPRLWLALKLAQVVLGLFARRKDHPRSGVQVAGSGQTGAPPLADLDGPDLSVLRVVTQFSRDRDEGTAVGPDLAAQAS